MTATQATLRVAIAAHRAGVRSKPLPTERAKAHAKTEKKCLGCNHWLKAHPDHSYCLICQHNGKVCEFQDPEPGRPDIIFSRDQIERMRENRFVKYRDRLYLMKDGRYGVLDVWTDRRWFW